MKVNACNETAQLTYAEMKKQEGVYRRVDLPVAWYVVTAINPDRVISYDSDRKTLNICSNDDATWASTRFIRTAATVCFEIKNG